MELALGKEDSSKMETHVKALTREIGDKSDIRNPRKFDNTLENTILQWRKL